jgi:NADH-quinone oxidoreductase subunit J
MALVLMRGFQLRGALAHAAKAIEGGQHEAAGHRDLHAVPVPAATGGGAAAGGHHRGHRADAARRKDSRHMEPGRAGPVRKADRVRIVKMAPTIEKPSARRRRKLQAPHDAWP